MRIHVARWAQDFNCPECGIGLECDEADEAPGTKEIVCPECNTKLYLTQRLKYIVRAV